MRSGWHQVQEVYKKELDLAGKANPPRVLGFPAERDFRFSSALRLMAQLPTASHKRCSNQVIKFCKTRTSLMPCAPNLFKYKHFRTGRQIPSLFLLISFTTGFSSWQCHAPSPQPLFPVLCWFLWIFVRLSSILLTMFSISETRCCRCYGVWALLIVIECHTLPHSSKHCHTLP